LKRVLIRPGAASITPPAETQAAALENWAGFAISEIRPMSDAPENPVGRAGDVP